MGIVGLDGALDNAPATCLKFGVAPCTRKRVRRMIGKLSWLAGPTPFLSPFVAGTYAHTLWGPRYSTHAPLSLLRVALPPF